MSEYTKESGCHTSIPEIRITEDADDNRKQSGCSENSIPDIGITDDDNQRNTVTDSSVKSVPDVKIEMSDIGIDNSGQTEDEPRFLVFPVRDRKLSSHQTNLSDISEDEALDDFRTRKVSIMAGNPEIRHYIPHHHQPRKVSTDSFYLSPYVIPRSRKSSMDAFYCQPPHHQRMSVISIVSSNEDTCEATPHADHYKDIFSILPEYEVRQRPTLDELREDSSSGPRSPRATATSSDLFADELEEKPAEIPTKRLPVSSGLKFGWIQGVLVRCLLNIFGVMLFLRLTWVTGQAGIGLASVIVLLSAVVTIITTASMSAICTNGEVKGGGAYYMISRSLGPEFGGSIGVVFSLANAVAGAMYIVGFAETVQDLMMEFDTTITGDRMHDVRIIGCATAVVLLCILVIGMEWEAKAQLGLLVILVVAIINFFVGTFIPPSTENQWKGVVGYSAKAFSDNFGPDFREGNSFFSVFSIFFPAATGILAGANISGDLKDPQKAIPKGTFLAIVLTTIIYLGMAWASGGCMIRDAVGPVVMATVANQTNITLPSIDPTIDVVSDCSAFNQTCKYGLQNDNGAVGLAAAFRPLILAGIFSATLSSALASMIGAPKVFQALGKDKLFPFLKFFAKGYGRGGEPRRGYVLTFIICLAMTCIGALDLIAPIISNFFLMAYTLINYSCFHASMANTPGFRPAFKYYNKWISLIGALVCLAVMFLINWWAALVTFLIVGALYLYVAIKKPDVNWGSSTQAYAYRDALKSTMKLVKIEEHVKNFRPQILVMSGYPRNRPALIDFASLITKKQSLLISGHIFRGEMSEHVKNLRSTAAYKWFETRKIKAFYNSVVAPTLRTGSQVLMQALGVGKLRPNTIFLGYKNDWIKSDPYDVEDYVNIVHDAFDLHYGVGILRIPDGLDVNKVPDDLVGQDEGVESDEGEYSDEDDDDDEKSQSASESQATDASHTSSEFPGEHGTCSSYNLNNKAKVTFNSKAPQNHVVLKSLNRGDGGIENKAFEAETKISSRPTMQTLISTVSSASSGAGRFRNKLYGTIDVWWLYDDGGLTLLIPHILSTRKKFKNCQLRVFFAGSKKGKPDEEQARMAALLSKFRIEYSQLTIVPDLWKKPSLNVYKEFDSVIRKWRLRPGEMLDTHPWKIRDSDLLAHKYRTYRNLRLREQLLVHSSEASLIFMTLPMPRKVECPAGLYMGWLEMLSRDMPPMLLLRGNQQSVLTYYS